MKFMYLHIYLFLLAAFNLRLTHGWMFRFLYDPPNQFYQGKKTGGSFVQVSPKPCTDMQRRARDAEGIRREFVGISIIQGDPSLPPKTGFQLPSPDQFVSSVPVRYLGFWTRGDCDRLPSAIAHFYSTPSTVQKANFSLLEDYGLNHDMKWKDRKWWSWAELIDLPNGAPQFPEIPAGAMAARTTRDGFFNLNSRAEFLIAHDTITVDPINSHFRSKDVPKDSKPTVEKKELTMNPAVPLADTSGANGNRYSVGGPEKIVGTSPSQPVIVQADTDTQRATPDRKTSSQLEKGPETAELAAVGSNDRTSLIDSLMSSGGKALLAGQEVAKQQLESELLLISSEELIKLRQHPLYQLPKFQLADLLLRTRLEKEFKDLPEDERESEIQFKLAMADYERQGGIDANSSEISEEGGVFEEYLEKAIRQTGAQGTDTKMEEEYSEEYEGQNYGDYIKNLLEKESSPESEGDDDDLVKIEEFLKKELSTAVQLEDNRAGGYAQDAVKIEADDTSLGRFSRPRSVIRTLDASQIDAQLKRLAPQMEMSGVPPETEYDRLISETIVKEEN
ncbi:hypothetical protein AOL_s00210g184 [Orbilia oligospora ATCC 24927]|uniref:Uncharacterized protein n=1 Tax=Arthrobotrys oligospora (strain ATCC 24927 / CBS 115.81 / DSM 1491) TaxID=756982 RepID=G1XS26_ARTOA|nr:hypothetical protein AOL_s00210g184 [Orbilia oligospora ATCC 24927]EGX44023.1 hypothetical protein AOL_s00210g184 [Orbilia oligospora ATCC 24927]